MVEQRGLFHQTHTGLRRAELSDAEFGHLFLPRPNLSNFNRAQQLATLPMRMGGLRLRSASRCSSGVMGRHLGRQGLAWRPMLADFRRGKRPPKNLSEVLHRPTLRRFQNFRFPHICSASSPRGPLVLRLTTVVIKSLQNVWSLKSIENDKIITFSKNALRLNVFVSSNDLHTPHVHSSRQCCLPPSQSQ